MFFLLCVKLSEQEYVHKYPFLSIVFTFMHLDANYCSYYVTINQISHVQILLLQYCYTLQVDG